MNLLLKLQSASRLPSAVYCFMVSSPFVYDLSEVVFCYWFMSYMKLFWSKGELGSLCQDDIDRTVVLLSAYQWECMEQ